MDVVLQDVWVLYHIIKEKGDESLPTLAFYRDVVYAIFLKYSKKGRLSSSHAGIQNIPSDVCYDNTKHYRCILNTDVFRTPWNIEDGTNRFKNGTSLTLEAN